MTLKVYLLYRNKIREEDRNPSGANAVIISAADVATAIADANDAAPNGSTRVPGTWLSMQIGTTDTPLGPIWIEGDAVPPGVPFRGS